MLWVDKHRPKDFESLKVHPEIAMQLSRMAAPDVVMDLPNLMFYGPPGAGKKTLVLAMLNQIFQGATEKIRVDVRTFKVSGGIVVDNDKAGDAVDITLIRSNHHIELNPCEVGPFKDRLITQAIVKEIAQSHAPTASAVSYKVIILNEVNRLSKDAQAALRRTLEKYTTACRFVLLCNNPCRVIEPLRSRCVCIRVPAPDHQKIMQVLHEIAEAEMEELPEKLAKQIVLKSEGNIRRAILSLETCRVQQSPLSENQNVEEADWEKFIGETAKLIMSEQSPNMMMNVREHLYELLTNCIPPDVIIRKLALNLISKCDDSYKPEIIKYAAFFEGRMHRGSKPIFHLEAFILKFMSIYKRELLNVLWDQ